MATYYVFANADLDNVLFQSRSYARARAFARAAVASRNPVSTRMSVVSDDSYLCWDSYHPDYYPARAFDYVERRRRAKRSGEPLLPFPGLPKRRVF